MTVLESMWSVKIKPKTLWNTIDRRIGRVERTLENTKVVVGRPWCTKLSNGVELRKLNGIRNEIATWYHPAAVYVLRLRGECI